MLSMLIYAIFYNLINSNWGWAWKPIPDPSLLSAHDLHQYQLGAAKVNAVNVAEIAQPLSLDTRIDNYDRTLETVASAVEDSKYAYRHVKGPDVSEIIFQESPCAVKKYAFNYDGIAKYKNKIPELNQFTICYWMRFTNHTGDHVLLTYSAGDEPREIQLWIANAKNSSFLSMAIKGQQLYRLNYPLRIHEWHHTCSSWNGKTGEWQIWIHAERIGRGFHNSLVGHKIPFNGKLFSGGPSVTGHLSAGLHFEMTLLQIYKVALSAGKAHRDHKHHHAHHFDHEGRELSTTVMPTTKIYNPLPTNNLLVSGQIPTRVKINLAARALPPSHIGLFMAGDGTSPPSSLIESPDGAESGDQTVTINTNFINGQFHAGTRWVAQQLLGTIPRTQQPIATSPVGSFKMFNALKNPANIKFVDETETRILFKRGAEPRMKVTLHGANTDHSNRRTLKKRELKLLEDGSVVDDLDQYKFGGLAEFASEVSRLTFESNTSNIEDEIKEHDREPAEEETKAVMAVCGTCDAEPFQGALVFAWKDADVELDNALRGISVGGCGQF